jgi:trimeric autotransporter adhesin
MDEQRVLGCCDADQAKEVAQCEPFPLAAPIKAAASAGTASTRTAASSNAESVGATTTATTAGAAAGAATATAAGSAAGGEHRPSKRQRTEPGTSAATAAGDAMQNCDSDTDSESDADIGAGGDSSHEETDLIDDLLLAERDSTYDCTGSDDEASSSDSAAQSSSAAAAAADSASSADSAVQQLLQELAAAAETTVYRGIEVRKVAPAKLLAVESVEQQCTQPLTEVTFEGGELKFLFGNGHLLRCSGTVRCADYVPLSAEQERERARLSQQLKDDLKAQLAAVAVDPKASRATTKDQFSELLVRQKYSLSAPLWSAPTATLDIDFDEIDDFYISSSGSASSSGNRAESSRSTLDSSSSRGAYTALDLQLGACAVL